MATLSLWDHFDICNKGFENNKKNFNDYIQILQDRADLEDYYASKGDRIIQNIFNQMQNDIQMQSKIVLSAIKQDLLIRVEQSKILSQQLKIDVISLLKEFAQKHLQEQKSLLQKAKQNEKEIKTYIDNMDKSQLRYEKISKQVSENELYNQTLNIKSSKSDQLIKDQIEYCEKYKSDIMSYNIFNDGYTDNMNQIITQLNSYGTEKIKLMSESLLKIMVFQISSLRNIQYESDRIIKNLEVNQKKYEDNIQEPEKFKLNIQKFQPYIDYFNYKQEEIILETENLKMFEMSFVEYTNSKKQEEFAVLNTPDLHLQIDIIMNMWEHNYDQDLQIFEKNLSNGILRYFSVKAIQIIGKYTSFGLSQNLFLHLTSIINMILTSCQINKDTPVARVIMKISQEFYLDYNQIQEQNVFPLRIPNDDDFEKKVKQMIDDEMVINGIQDKDENIQDLNQQQKQDNDVLKNEDMKNEQENELHIKQEENEKYLDKLQINDIEIKNGQQKYTSNEIPSNKNNSILPSKLINTKYHIMQISLKGHQIWKVNLKINHILIIYNKSNVLQILQIRRLLRANHIYFSKITQFSIFKNTNNQKFIQIHKNFLINIQQLIEFWESLVLKMIQEEMWFITQKNIQEQDSDVIFTKNIIFNKLDFCVKQMLVFFLPKSEAKKIAQKIAKVFQLFDSQMKELNQNIDNYSLNTGTKPVFSFIK